MHRTEQKLREAEFFLAQMSETRGTDEFAFYLSAFVSAARSVSWIFRAECKDIPGWVKWYDQKTPLPEELHLLKQLNAIRVRSEKFEPLAVGLRVEVQIPPDQLTLTARDALEASARSGGKLFVERLKDDKVLIRTPKAQVVGELHELILTLAEFPDADIQTISVDYLRLIRSLVDDWIDQSAT